MLFRSRTLKSESRVAFLRNIVADRVRIVCRKYLLAMDDEEFAKSDFEFVYARLMPLLLQCGVEVLEVPVNNLLCVDLLGFWQRKGRRYRSIVRRLLVFADRSMVSVHALLFRK